MPFDFNKQPLRIYGIWPQTPFPLEVSIYGYCQMACSFCFANRNRDANERELHLENSTPTLFRQIDRAIQDEYNPIGFFLREKYPICFSNTTDPFQRAEKQYRSTEAFLSWSGAARTPLFIQTRGNVLLEEWERYSKLLIPGLHVVYLSICQLDDAIRHKQEPGAQSIDRRFELARRLSDHGIPVVVACNPYVKEWVPEPVEYVKRCAEAGVKGIWLESLHFTGAQSDVLAAPYRDLLFKANPQPMYLIGDLRRWYTACDAAGIDFFPSPKWDGYFGHKAQHPECADPAWLGGKTLDFSFRLLKAINRLSAENEKGLVLFGWPEIKKCLEALEVPNPTLNVGPFWYPYNNQVKADHENWKARLGKTAELHEIIRYFFNHPWECQNLVWYHPRVQAVFNNQEDKYTTGEEGDLIASYSLKAKHNGPFELDEGTIDLESVAWPAFGSEATAVGRPASVGGSRGRRRSKT